MCSLHQNVQPNIIAEISPIRKGGKVVLDPWRLVAHSSRRTSKGSPGHPGGIIHAIGPRVEGAAAWSGRHATCPLSRSRFASRELFQNRARRSADGDFSVISQPTTFILEAKLSTARSTSVMRTRLRAAATRRPRCGDGTDALSSRVLRKDTLCVISA